ncbi:TetR/AcrR family transcriptional regulator [Euzebya sp.]|uniref:TetR/AcrR family transcriptional regulator n=1 Tax=Euzebya sp. TaxID=1971409 RepID=UPI003512FBB0
MRATPDAVGDLTTRARIRDAAMEAFAEHGYQGATMRGIAAAAGVSLGLVQHHFGTKDGLRSACDERVLELIRFKTTAIDAGRLSDPQVLSILISMAPVVQRYVGRAMVDGSTAIDDLVDQVMSASEAYLSSTWPDRFEPGSPRTRDAAAVLTALNTSTMVLQAHIARRMGIEPFTESTVRRIGQATFDAYEAIADLTASEWWREVRAATSPDPTGA